MEFDAPPEHALIRSTATDIASEHGPEYWREKEAASEFATEFWDELGEAGFHGLLIPEEYEGAGMGLQEMGLAMETLCAEGCGMAGTWYLVVTAGMAAIALRESGTEEQKAEYLPDVATGDRMFSFAITEPDAGTNTLNVGTRAERDGDEYVLNGKKAWITFADRADDLILVTRTTPKAEVTKPTKGLSLFLVDMDDPGIEVSPIPKHGLNYSKSCEVFIEDVRVPETALLGEEDEGWWHLVKTLNPERIGFAAGATGVAELAVSKAVDYANDREVFDAPIGTHQGVSFPITQAYTNVETARLMRQKAAWLFDQGRECGYESNVAKAAAVEAGIDAVYHAMQAFGGWGYATEYDVERWWREINLTRLAPVTQQMAYNHIGQEMGFPRSY